jgi:hypothetical protein
LSTGAFSGVVALTPMVATANPLSGDQITRSTRATANGKLASGAAEPPGSR